MGKLLKKEFALSLNPNVIIMALLGATILIPSYPGFVGFIYILGGLFSIMPRAAADKDIEYTSMLPIPKRDVVLSKILLFVALELGTILITVPFACLRNFVIDQNIIAAGAEEETVESMLAMEPSLSTYGFAFLLFGVYNILFFPWFYKNPAKINTPQIVSTIVTMLLAIVFVMLPIIPGLSSYLSASSLSDQASLITQIIVLAVGIIGGVVMTILSFTLSAKHFEKVDI